MKNKTIYKGAITHMRGKQQDFRTEKYIRYGIRKFSFGAASVAIAVGLMFLGNGVVSAMEVPSAETAITTSTSSQGDKEMEKAEPKAETVETVKSETVSPETIKPETVNPETVKPETVNPETVNSETMKPETVNPETEKATEVKSEVAATKAATKATLANTDASQADVDAQAETVSALSTAVTESNTAEKKLRPTEIYTTNGTPGTACTAVKTNAKYANSMETVDNNKRGNRENTHSINQRPTVKRSPIDTTEFAQNYGRKVLAGSVTNTGFSVSDPDYPSGMWIDPDKSHYSYEWLQAKIKGKNDGNQIVFSTNRTGDGIVYVTELSKSNEVLKQYTLNQNTQVESAIFDSTIYYNDVYFEMVRSSSNSFVTKYTASKFDNNYYNTLSYFVPKLITQTTYYVDKDGKQIIDSNGNPVAAYTQKGLVGQNYTTSDVTVVNGYYAIAPANSNGVMSPYGKIGASYVKNFHDGVVITYTQTGSDGTMSASIAQDGKVLKTWTNLKPSDPTTMYNLYYNYYDYETYGIKNPYIPQTSDIKYVYNKLGNWIVYNPDGSKTSIIYPNDPSDPTKIADSSVPGYPVIDFLPGYTPKDHMGTPLVPVDPDDHTKGYIPPTPSDIGKDTTITYTADKQKGSVSYVDDTTGKTLKTDSISGTTGSKSSYSISGSIADYKKQGYELVTDGYPADLTFDNDDTTDQNFTVHLKHRLTPVNPTDPQTPGAPINPDEPDGPKWPEGTDKSSVTQTVIRTVNYLDKQTGKVVAKQVTEQVTYNRTAIVDKVTGQIIGYSTTGGDTVDQTDGNKAWTAVDNKSDWDSVTSPDLSSKGYLAPDLAKVAQQTVTPGDAVSSASDTKSAAQSAATAVSSASDTRSAAQSAATAARSARNRRSTVNVYYDHDVVPVNPTNPQTPGTPINPDDPDSPKWPAGTDKNSLTTDVHQTIHYQYGDGSQAAPDKTDSTTFDHQVEIDKVTGEIVKDDGWKAENGKTSFDSKKSPVIPGYTASKPASDSVDGLTQDSKDNVQTIIDTSNQEAANVTYIDDKTGKTLSDKDLTGDYGSTDPYRTGDTIADYEKQGYQLVSDNYPTHGVVYNQDGTVQKFEVHLTHGTTPVGPNNPQTPGAPIHPDEPDGPKWPTSTNYDKTVNETVSYVDQTGHVVAKQHTDSVNFTRTVVVDNVTGEVITSGAGTTAWTAKNGDTTFDAVVSPVVSGSVANKAQTATVTDLNADSANVTETVTYTKVGSLVPSSSDGNFPRVPTVVYPNDPSDATKVTPAGVPTVSGYTAHNPEGHVLKPGSSYQPSDPTKDTTITYTADTQKVTVTYVVEGTGTVLHTDNLEGKSGETIGYSTVAKLAELKALGYDLVTDGFTTATDKNFDKDTKVDQSFVVTVKPHVEPIKPVDPENPNDPNKPKPGDPIDPNNPDGPKWTEDLIKQIDTTRHVNRTITSVNEKGEEVAQKVTDKVTFTREGKINSVTGEITYGNWTAKDGDTTFDKVESPVVQGYILKDAKQKEVAATTGLTVDSKDENIEVVYTKLGSWVPKVPEGFEEPKLDKPQYPNDPTDPTKPGTPTTVIPQVPGTTPKDSNGNPLKPVDPNDPSKGYVPPTPENPTEDTVINYVPVPQPVRPTDNGDNNGTPTTAAQPASPSTPQYMDGKRELPNTGTEDNASLAALGLLGVLSGFGLVAYKKKED